MVIKMKDPVRNAFAGCSTTNNYYDTKGHAVSAFDDALKEHGYCFDDNDIVDMPGDAGRVNIDVCTGQGESVSCALLSWYRMPSGRYEFTGYLA